MERVKNDDETSGGEGVAERNLSLRPRTPEGATLTPVFGAATAAPCGGESPLLLTLPRHEKAPLLLLVLL